MSVPTDIPMTDDRKYELCQRPFARFNPEVKELIWNNRCTTCRREITPSLFKGKDPVYRREYNISGMCPSCQDEVF